MKRFSLAVLATFLVISCCLFVKVMRPSGYSTLEQKDSDILEEDDDVVNDATEIVEL